jgi:hypothetical protein
MATGDENGNYGWVENPSETLGTSIAYQAQINGYCWTGTHNPGESCHMNEELEHDYGDYNAYRKKFNRGKHKKVKHRHLRL